MGLNCEKMPIKPKLQNRRVVVAALFALMAGSGELIATSNVYAVKAYGPDRVALLTTFRHDVVVSTLPAHVIFSLIGGTCLSFYDWYCDLPPTSPQTRASRPTCRNPLTGTTQLYYRTG